MTIKQQLEHAKKYGYPVRVTLISGHSEEGTVFALDEDSYGLRDIVCRWRDYTAIASVEPLEPEVEPGDWFGWQCHVAYGCNDRQGTGRYCKDKTCQHRMIWKDIAAKAEESRDPPAHDEAPEQWHVCKMDNTAQPWITDKRAIFKYAGVKECPEWGHMLARATSFATDAQMEQMAAAPDMLDALRTIECQADATPGDLVKIQLAHKTWKEILATIKKAEGGDSE